MLISWVAYAVGSLSTAIGDGVFLPAPESGGLIVNVGDVDKHDRRIIGSGDRRDNRAWMIGRLIRDLQIKTERAKKRIDKDLLDAGLLVTIYQLDHCTGKSYKPGRPKKDWLWWSFAWAIPCQLVVACVPWIVSRNWSIFLITSVGNVLAMLTASLPSMRKATFRKHSRQSYALTRGNGHKHVFIIIPNTTRAYVDGESNKKKHASLLPHLEDMASSRESASTATRILSAVSAVLWVLLLLAIAGLKSDTWYLFGAGMVGMIVNVLLSGYPRDPAAYGLPLVQVMDGEFGFKKQVDDDRLGVQDVLLQLEKAYPGAGHALRGIFFTGLPSERDLKWTDAKEVEVNLESAQGRLNDRPHPSDVPLPEPQSQEDSGKG